MALEGVTSLTGFQLLLYVVIDSVCLCYECVIKSILLSKSLNGARISL